VVSKYKYNSICSKIYLILYLLEDVLMCWSQGANQLTVPLTGWQVLSSSVYSVGPPAVFSAPPVGQQ